jgi:hypothetical protein
LARCLDTGNGKAAMTGGIKYGDAASTALPIEERPSFYALAKDDLIEIEPGGYEIGCDPRKVPREVLARYHTPMPVLRAIRAKCIDCSGGNASEVCKCTAPAYPLWPFRMGANPHRDTSAYRAAGFKKPGKNGHSGDKSDADGQCTTQDPDIVFSAIESGFESTEGEGGAA